MMQLLKSTILCLSYVLYTQILKQSVLKPASPGITLKTDRGGSSNACNSKIKYPFIFCTHKTLIHSLCSDQYNNF